MYLRSLKCFCRATDDFFQKTGSAAGATILQATHSERDLTTCSNKTDEFISYKLNPAFALHDFMNSWQTGGGYS